MNALLSILLFITIVAVLILAIIGSLFVYLLLKNINRDFKKELEKERYFNDDRNNR